MKGTMQTQALGFGQNVPMFVLHALIMNKLSYKDGKLIMEGSRSLSIANTDGGEALIS